MHRKLAFLAVGSTVLAACSDPTTPSGAARLAPIMEVSANVQAQVIPDEYIVVLRTPPRGASALLAELQGMAGISSVQLLGVYGAALNGFAIKATPAALAALRANANIDFVQPNQVVSAIATQSPTPSWGLDRIDQRNLPLDNSFTYPTGGAVVHAYIIDTGIRMTHNEFTGRIGNATDCIGGQTPPGNDGNGHGTHVAGTVGGTTYGITKNAVLHAVRVLDNGGSGSSASVICGINWVVANFTAPAVSNMSLGGGADAAIDNATNGMVAAGVVSAVAAGNNNADACNSSPARAVNAITVGAIGNFATGTPSDNRASFSNFGTCLDIFAPGVAITSSWNTSNTATNSISGTSMASPHVAGVAALYRSFNPAATATQVATALISNATLNVVGSPGTGSPNRLLYMGFIGGGPPPTNQNPVANFTYNCVPKPDGTGFDCTFNGTTSTDPDGNVVAWSWSSPNRPAKTGAIVTYPFPNGSTPSVTLTVTDNAGGTNSKTQQINLGGPPPPTNQPPVANFTYNCVPRTPNVGSDCTFNASTSTDDGTIVSYAWSAPNKPPKTGVIATYPFPAGSHPSVTLTVTDNGGLSNSKTIQITIP